MASSGIEDAASLAWLLIIVVIHLPPGRIDLQPGSLPDLGSVGYKSGAAVQFSPHSWPIAGL